jgi:signal peptidase II
MTTSHRRSDHTEDADARHEPASGSAPHRRGILFALAASLALVDLILKELAQARLNTPVDLGILELRLAYNPGVAFSLGQSLPEWLVLVATAIITLGVAGFAYATAGKADVLHRLGLAAILAGAVANVIDRIGDGVVTDYLHTGWFPTFNLADTWITLGAATLLVSVVLGDRHNATHSSAG